MHSTYRCRLASAIVISIVLLVGARVAGAQTPRPRGTIGFQLTVTAPGLQGRPVMVSAFRDGKMVEQQEERLGNGSTLRGDSLTQGLYDVRVEGEGIVTEEKRGVHLFGGQELSLIFQLRSGKGVHIVEYATGPLSREEIAAHLARLDAEVAELTKTRAQKSF